MPITIVGATSAAVDVQPTITVNVPTGLAAGDVLLGVQHYSYSGSTNHSAATGFTQAAVDVSQPADATAPRIVVYTRVVTNPGAEPASYTFGASTNANNVLFLIAVRGVDTTSIFADSFAAQGTPNATSHTLPTRTLTTNNCLFVGVFTSQYYNTSQNTAWTAPALMSAVIQRSAIFNNGLVAAETRNTGATGTRVATVSNSGSAGKVASFALREAVATDIPVPVSDGLTVTEAASQQVTVQAADTTTISESVAVGIPIDRDDTLTVTEAAFADADTAPQETTTTTELVAFDASLGVSDSGTVTESPHVEASFTVADVPFGVADDVTIINVAADAAAVDETLHIDAQLVVGDSWTLSEGAVVQERYGDLLASIWAVNPGTGALHALPDFTELNLAPTRNGPGTIGLTYPKAGVNAHLLAAAVAADRDLEVEIWTTGSPLGARRGYLQEAAGDDVAEEDELWQFAGGFAELRMAEARVWPQPLVGEISLGDNVSVKQTDVTGPQWTRLVGPLGFVPTEGGEDGPTLSVPQKVLDAVKANAADIPVLADPKRELVLAAASPGDAMHLLLAQARSRGALTDITTSFTGTHDSSGVAWTQQVSARVSPGATYESVLNMLASLGRVEWSVTWTGTQQCLNLYRAEGRGVDRTVGLRPVVLRASRNIAEAPRKWSIRSSSTAMGAVGAEGVYADTNSLDAQSRRGRRIEGWTSSQNLTTEDAVLAYAQRRLGSEKDGTLEVTHGLALVPGEPRPVVAFDIGDWVYSQTATDLERYRVVEWSLTVNAERQMTATVTLNDAFVDEVVRQRQQLDAISSGEVVTGTSEPGESHTGFPMPPTGLVISSGAFNTGIDAYAVVNLGWLAPTINTNGTALTDLQGFRVEWTEEANWEAWRFAADVGAQATSAQWTTAVNLPIRYRVRAYNRSGRSSEWATGSTVHTTESDTDPPGVPSAPVGGGSLGLIDFRWDGLTEDGADMLQAYPDFKWVELHISTSSMFTPDESTLADHIFGKGTYTYSQLPDGTSLNYETTYFCRLVAVDRLDNASDPSGQGSAVPGQVLSPDIFDGAVGSVKLADAAVVTAKIANLAVTDAKIQNLSVGKLTAGILEASMIIGTGKIATGTTGARSEMDSAGFRLYNSAGAMTVQMSSANGSAMISGEYRTSLTTGLRLVFNPNGTQPDEIRFYPASTNQYGRIKTLTSVSPVHPNQAGLVMKAFSPRGDQQSGEVAVFPNYARLAFSNEIEQGTVSSTVITEIHQAGIGGPRVHVTCAPYSSQGDSGIIRLGATDNANVFIQRAVFSIFGSGSNRDGNVKAGCVNRFSYIQYDTGALSVINDTTWINIGANTFVTNSERRAKTDIEAEPFDPIGVISAADWYRYKKRGTLVPGRANPDQLGLMVDEMPDEVLVYNEDQDSWGIDIYGALAVLWGGTRRHIVEIDNLRRELAELRAHVAGRPKLVAA
ncbi:MULTISPECIES: hypothetical protein [Pseudonocardia]|uniref:Fibronectin type-III domain-containing protein n=2 Tax=Pseudonocardia TaxID=1847 RepID=A0A1Y2N652_PSEAH|nr:MULTISPECIES: hypothetical protein [Pseudonocardia]OSY42944.1 hypothetical protein BG845_01186 [Pseudonocardia autotrophica]TDN77520.1 hypothetical protein C8E95_6768 [Pseudonocardia autotrophica]BBG01545.1 hypothetical protein Pdca_27540 [Pseudonocardia autotrophica]GEC25329.1 hypothetical protein PSA01_23580 [Pseudonocardia saturnea]